jgi:pimeloyl-ACP methyl ester carboxylesterase
MPLARIAPDLALFYLDECFADPWRQAEPVLLLHGNAESGEAWNAWMPTLARHLRVIRPDMRGFGRSPAMPIDHPWSIDGLVDDYIRFADHLGLARFHLVAAKIAGPIAFRLAARHPDRVQSLVKLGATVAAEGALNDRAAAWLEHIERHGVESWARWTMPARLGADCPAEMLEGWARLMGATPASTQAGFIRSVPAIDARPDLPRVTCPTLVVTTDGNGLSSVESVLAWQRTIPRCELMVLPGSSYHVAATHPEACARAALDFFLRNAAA